jgi:tetratricopeptide (TPR) repeat protein
MLEGDYGRAAQLTLNLIKARDADTAMRFAMHIASGVSAERAARIEQQKNSALFGNAINFPFDDKEFLAAWGVADLGAAYRSPVRSDVPTLFLSGTLDGRTSIADAAEVLKGFTHGQQVIVAGAAHDFYHLSPAVLAVMNDFLDDKPVVAHISIPLEFRGPDEPPLIAELRKLVLEKGAEAAVKRLREICAPNSKYYVTSYVAGTLGVGLLQQGNRMKEGLEILKAGVELFPDSAFLHERLAEVYVVSGNKDLALEHYKKTLALNPLNRLAVLKIKELSTSN